MSLRLTAALVAAGLLILLVTGAYWKGRIEGAAGERSKAAAARAAAAVAEVETRGERESAQRAEIVVRQRTAADRAVAELARDAHQSEDADEPLDPGRAARLRAHDERLCDANPGLAGCAPVGDAAGGDPALRTPPAARGADAR